MTQPDISLIATHNTGLVVLSVGIAIIASYTALNLAGRVTVAQGRTRILLWLTGGAIAMGVGIWSMHFIAMLAYNLPIGINYNLPIVLVSMVVAIIASGVALFVVSRPSMNKLQLLTGGVFMGLGVAAMHYTGMAAMELDATPVYDLKLVALSIGIAIAASLTAMRLAFDFRADSTSVSAWKLGSAVIMGNAIAGMHYTAMAAVNFYPKQLISQSSSSIDNYLLGIGIGIATLIILTLALTTSLFEQRISIETTKAELLRQSEERFRSLVQNASDIIVVVAADRTVSYASPTIKSILGYEPDAWKNAFEFVHPEDMTQAESLLTKALQGESVNIAAQFRLKHADGQTRDFEVIANNLLHEPGLEGILTTYRDITQRKQAEAEITKLNEDLQRRAAELEAANKELEAFSYSVSHDLRAPLRAINGFSRILSNEYTSQIPPEARRYLQMVQDNAQQMGCLVDDLLAFSRLSRSSLSRQAVAPSNIVSQVFTDLSHEQENRHVEIAIAQLPECQADPALLKQVWINLIANALKYTRQREVAYIEVGYKYLNSKLVYFVKDNGVGFDMRYAHKLFGVFQRLHRAEDYEGTGVGLAIVQRIIHRHGGSVWAEAEVNKGATFYFSLEENYDDDNDGRNPLSGGQSLRRGINTALLEKQ